MASNNIDFRVGFNVDKQGLNSIKKELADITKVIEKNQKDGIIDQATVDKSISQIRKLEGALNKAFDTDTGILNIKKLNKELSKTETSLEDVQRAFKGANVSSGSLFQDIQREAIKTGAEIKKTKGFIDEMAETISNTAKWNLASGAVNTLTNSIQRAVGFVKALDNSLTQIRIVTGKSSDEMKIFSQQANEAAKALGRSTTEYTDASLIFFQQGKTAEEVKALTEATLVGANVTGMQAAETAEMLTAVMNGYQLEASKAMEVTDKLAAVGAATGSDFEEMATAMSKVASQAANAGVSIDQLGGMISTVSTVTREAPEVIGTSFKTILGRLADLRVGKEAEGWDTGQVEQALNKVGMSVLDQNGKLKESGDILTELGTKWNDLNKESQVVVAKQIAGLEQYNRLISLMENWGMYEDALAVSQDSAGAAMEQNAIRMDSIDAKLKNLRTEAERLYMSLADEDFAKGAIDGLAKMVGALADFTTGLGGLDNMLMVVGGTAANVFNKQIAKSLTEMGKTVAGKFGKDLSVDAGRSEAAVQEIKSGGDDQYGAKSIEIIKERTRMRENEAKVAKTLSNDELKDYQERKNKILELQEVQKQALLTRRQEVAESKKLLQDKKMESLTLEQMKKANDKNSQKIQSDNRDLANKKAVLEQINGMIEDEENIRNRLAELNNRDEASLSRKEKILQSILKATIDESKANGDVLEDSELLDDAWMKLHDQILITEDSIKKTLEVQRALNVAIEEGSGEVSAETISSETQGRIEALQSEQEAIEKTAKKREFLNKAIQGVGLAAGIYGAVKDSVKVLGDETATTEEKTNALAASMTSMGTVLMSTGNPYLMIIGAITTLGSGLVKLAHEFSPLNRMIESNAKALEDYKLKLQDIREEQNNLRTSMAKLTEAENIAADGLIPEEMEEYNRLINEAAEATPTIVKYYDAYGNAVLKSREEIENHNESLKESINLAHNSMQAQAGSFSAEMAYLLNDEKERQLALEEKIVAKQEELNKLMTEGGSDKKIQDTREELAVLMKDMDDLNAKFSEINQYAQEAIVNPFVQGEEIFKDLGTEMQGYVAGLFNSNDITKGIEKLAASGRLSTKELQVATEEYINRYKEGVLEVANAFDNIRKAAEGGNKESIKTIEMLKTIPQDMQNLIGEAMRGMGTVLDEGQLQQKITELMNKAGEDGKLTALEIKQFFDEQSVEIGANLGEQLIEAGNRFKDSFLEISDSLASSLKIALNDYAFDEVTGEVINEEAQKVLDALNQGNMEMAMHMIESNAEIRQMVLEELQSQADNEGIFDSMITTDKEAEAQALYDKLAAYDELQEKQEIYNENLSAEGEFLDENLAKIWETAEGRQEIADVWNEMIEATSDMGEEGIFSVDIAAMEEENELLAEKAEQLRDNADANEEYAESTEALKKASQDVGKAFDKMAESLGEDTFGKLIEMTGQSRDELMSLADAAKKGSTDAARQLQSEMGKIYAAMRSQDQTYYREFVANNQARLNEVARVTGLEADEYKNLADYNADLQAWITNNGGQENFNRLMNLNEYVNSQVGMMGSAADATVQIGEHQMSAASAASVVAALEAAKGAVEAGKQGGAGGMAAAGQFIDALSASDEAVAAALGGIKGKLQDAGDDYNAIIAIINAEIEKVKGSIKDATGVTLDTNLKNFKPKPINYGGGGKVNAAPTKPSSRPSGTKGPSANSGGGGGKGGGKKPSGGKGGSGSDSSEKEVEDMEWEKDIYHDINAEIERKGKLLSQLQKQQDKLYGKELLDNLAKQKKLLQDQQKLYEQKLALQKQEAKNQADSLKSQGVKIDDATGMVLNYNDIIQAKVNAANKLSGEAKEDAIEKVKEFIEAIENYEQLVNETIWETQEAIQDTIDSQREIFLQEFDYKIQIQLELSDDFQNALDFQKELNKDFEDSSENMEITIQQMLDLADKAANIQEQINKINNDTSLTDKERLERLQEMSDALKDTVKELQSLDESMTKMFKDALKDGLELIEEHLDAYKDINKELKHMEQMAKLLGKNNDYQFLQSIYREQYDSFVGQIDILQKQKDVLIKQREALEAAGMKGSEEWKEVDQAIKDTTESVNKLVQDSIKALQNEFKAAVDEIMSSLEATMTNNLGFDKLKEQQKELKEERKKYLDTEEKLLAISKLQSKVQKEIDKTDDPSKKAKLQKFLDEEVKKLKEKDKLTKYDVDRANQLYDITMKQMALQDLQASKSVMRLVRDAQGNWVYEFTEDLNAISKAQQEASASLEKLHEMDKKKLQETQEEMLKAQEEYYKKVEKIVKNHMEGKYATEEEFQAALEEATTKFNEKMVDLNAEYEEIKTNTTISSMGVILDVYKNTSTELNGLTESQQAALELMAEKVGGDYQKLKDFMAVLINGDQDSISSAFRDLGITSEEIAGEIQDAMTTASNNAQSEWNTSIGDMISQIAGPGGSLKEESNNAIQSIMDKWAEYKDKVESVTVSTGNDMASMKDRIEEISTETDELNNKTDDLINTLDKELTAVTNVTTSFQQQREELQKLIDKYKDYIAQIDAAIKKKKEEATGVTTSGGTSSSGSNNKPPATSTPSNNNKPSSGSSGGGGSASSPKAPTTGSKVRVKSGRRWYYDSEGKNPSGPTDKYANQDLYVVNTSKNKYQYAVGKTTNINSALGWLRKEDLVGFDTGGYTGSWGKEGRIAMLHEKEIVLNQTDTSNILDAVKLIRNGEKTNSIANITKAIMETSAKTISALTNIVNSMMPNSNAISPISHSENFEQVVNINADFSGVRAADEIEKAFANMENMASQYANRTR